MRLDARARQDVAILGSEFLKLDGNFILFYFSLFLNNYLIRLLINFAF